MENCIFTCTYSNSKPTHSSWECLLLTFCVQGFVVSRYTRNVHPPQPPLARRQPLPSRDKMRSSCLRSFMNPFPGPKRARLTLNFVVTWLLDAKQSGAEIPKGPDPPPAPPHWGWIWETYVGELSWLRTSVACLELSGRVSVYASVVNWFLSSRQSPTVGRMAAPLPAVVGRCDCRHSVAYTWPAASRHDCTCWKVTW